MSLCARSPKLNEAEFNALVPFVRDRLLDARVDALNLCTLVLSKVGFTRLRCTRLLDASQLRRWVEDKRVVAERERAEVGSSAGPSGDAIAQALALVALYGRLHGWPAREDEVSRREDAQMYDRWHRLRIALRRRAR